LKGEVGKGEGRRKSFIRRVNSTTHKDKQKRNKMDG